MNTNKLTKSVLGVGGTHLWKNRDNKLGEPKTQSYRIAKYQEMHEFKKHANTIKFA